MHIDKPCLCPETSYNFPVGGHKETNLMLCNWLAKVHCSEFKHI